MLNELTALVEKAERLAALTYTLRQENLQLRANLQQAEQDKKNLSERLDLAALQIEQALQKLPGSNVVTSALPQTTVSLI